MISIKQNENFSNWYQVFSFGKLIDELNKKSKALRLAEGIARNQNFNYINVQGVAVRVEKPVFQKWNK